MNQLGIVNQLIFNKWKKLINNHDLFNFNI